MVQNAEIELRLEGKIFIDCTGDGIVADSAGCQWRMGSEGKDEFNEPHAPPQANSDTMGNSIHFLARDTGRPAPFVPPDWAVKHENASYFYDQGRLPKEDRGGFWWIEIGVPYHTIYDAETIRHELTRHALGVWDWMKNKDPKTKDRVKNYALDWIGQVPGKRESRRIIGRYFMTEHDIINRTVFPDEIAFGGWFVDLHTPGGLLAKTSEPSAAIEGEEYDTFSDYSAMSYCGPYGVPLRILLAREIDNLMMAGRNVSVTHAALGTVRVMGTTALMGEAAGVAAAVGLERGHDFDQNRRAGTSPKSSSGCWPTAACCPITATRMPATSHGPRASARAARLRFMASHPSRPATTRVSRYGRTNRNITSSGSRRAAASSSRRAAAGSRTSSFA